MIINLLYNLLYDFIYKLFHDLIKQLESLIFKTSFTFLLKQL